MNAFIIQLICNIVIFVSLLLVSFYNKQLRQYIDKIKEAWIDYQMVKDVDPDMEKYVNYIILGKWEFER